MRRRGRRRRGRGGRRKVRSGGDPPGCDGGGSPAGGPPDPLGPPGGARAENPPPPPPPPPPGAGPGGAPASHGPRRAARITGAATGSGARSSSVHSRRSTRAHAISDSSSTGGPAGVDDRDRVLTGPPRTARGRSRPAPDP